MTHSRSDLPSTGRCDDEGAWTRSFRDPSGQLVDDGKRILRHINEVGQADFAAFEASPWIQSAVDAGRVVASTRVAATGVPAGSLTVEHPRIWFISYPAEWPDEMLHAAAVLTLDLAGGALADGLSLKDATPMNVVFDGPKPVFVDVLSFERRRAGDPLWRPFGQFVRCFLLPLLLRQRSGLPLAFVFLGHRDGMTPEEAYPLLAGWRRWTPMVFGLVTLPTWLARWSSQVETRLVQTPPDVSPALARYRLEGVFRYLRRQLNRLAPDDRTSTWTGYMQSGRAVSYDQAGFAAKESWVAELLQRHTPCRVLDVGCNDGHFSVLAARSGARVVAIDSDAAVIGRLWRRAAAESLDILPMVVNMAWPTPGRGWRNAEKRSFLDRAAGQFDLVLMLAVIHHLLVSDGIPLEAVIAQVADLTTDLAVIEYVPPTDPMFRQLCRGREHLFADLSLDSFEAACRRHFDVLDRVVVGTEGRQAFLLQKTDASL